ncbi:Phosphoheptose isomerase [Pluralibacter gergoviae]|nr:Phosphoheptose isomerase [Pluralibacter gergoviae]
MYQDLIRNELNEAAETLNNFLADEANIHAIQRAAVLLADSFKAGGKVLSCGNGGSHCDAMHFAEELTGRYRETVRATRQLPSLTSAISPASATILAMSMFSRATWSPWAAPVTCCSASLLRQLRQCDQGH